MDKLKIKADFTKYIEVFLQKNAKLNLISKNDEKLLFEKHIYDSLGIKLFFEKYFFLVSISNFIKKGGTPFGSSPFFIKLTSNYTSSIRTSIAASPLR